MKAQIAQGARARVRCRPMWAAMAARFTAADPTRPRSVQSIWTWVKKALAAGKSRVATRESSADGSAAAAAGPTQPKRHRRFTDVETSLLLQAKEQGLRRGGSYVSVITALAACFNEMDDVASAISSAMASADQPDTSDAGGTEAVTPPRAKCTLEHIKLWLAQNIRKTRGPVSQRHLRLLANPPLRLSDIGITIEAAPVLSHRHRTTYRIYSPQEQVRMLALIESGITGDAVHMDTFEQLAQEFSVRAPAQPRLIQRWFQNHITRPDRHCDGAQGAAGEAASSSAAAAVSLSSSSASAVASAALPSGSGLVLPTVAPARSRIHVNNSDLPDKLESPSPLQPMRISDDLRCVLQRDAPLLVQLVEESESVAAAGLWLHWTAGLRLLLECICCHFGILIHADLGTSMRQLENQLDPRSSALTQIFAHPHLARLMGNEAGHLLVAATAEVRQTIFTLVINLLTELFLTPARVNDAQQQNQQQREQADNFASQPVVGQLMKEHQDKAGQRRMPIDAQRKEDKKSKRKAEDPTQLPQPPPLQPPQTNRSERRNPPDSDHQKRRMSCTNFSHCCELQAHI